MELIDVTNIFKNSLGYSWGLYMFKMNKNNGGSFVFDKASIEPNYFKTVLEEILDSYTNKTMDKMSTIFPYQEGVDPKGNLCFIPVDDIRVKGNIELFKEAIYNSGDQIANSYSGYVLVGKDLETKDELFLITKTNPISSLLANKLCPLGDIEEPKIVKLTKRIDCFIFKENLYAENLKFERIFGMSSSLRLLCETNRNSIIESKKFDETTNNMLLNDKLIRNFQNVNLNNIDKISSSNEELGILSKYVGFEISDEVMHIDNIDSTKKIIKYLSDKIVFKNGNAYEAVSLKPLVEINQSLE